ncbi:unnamed protein product, partial [Adineta steineri]
FFLEKYNEPDGKEIEQLAEVRQWTNVDEQNNSEETYDRDTIKQAVNEEFKSNVTPMALYVLGDHTMSEIVEIFFNNPENQLFDVMQSNVDDL